MIKKQQKIQITLILIGFLLIFTTYFYYPYMSRTKFVEDQPAHEDLEGIQDDERTFFKSVEYKGFYDLNKPFIIKSEEAYMLNEEPDMVYMINMHVILYLNDGRIVNITSDQGRYNKVSYDCYFEKNVIAKEVLTKHRFKKISKNQKGKILSNLKLHDELYYSKIKNIDNFKASVYDKKKSFKLFERDL